MGSLGQAVYFSRFIPSTDLGGGSRRLMQLWELLQPHGCDLWTSGRLDHVDGLSRRRLAGPAADDSGIESGWSAARRPAVGRLREVARSWAREAAARPGLGLALLEDPVYFLPLLEELERRSVPVAAVCHNLETLAPRQVEGASAVKMLGLELDALRRCRLAVTISREETWLLTNLGVSCHYFPYYPPERVLARLQAVRRRREAGGERRGILLLANAKNPQTGEGMERLIGHWRERKLHEPFGPLLVAGFHSERLFPDRGALEEDGGVRLLGTVEQGALDALLSRVAAALCYQESGSGALTRICELLLAGVPVLASPHAARSYHGRPGLIEFAGLDGLEGALCELRQRPPEAAPPAPPAAAPLLERLEGLAAGPDRRP